MGNCCYREDPLRNDVSLSNEGLQQVVENNERENIGSHNNPNFAHHSNENNGKPPKANVPILVGKLAVASYGLRTEDQSLLSFKKGDRLVIIDESDPDWFYARHLTHQTEGFIPKNYFSVDENAADEEWFFGAISRADSERLLLLPAYPHGTFLVRNSHITGAYALSIRVYSETKGDFVKHYKIRALDQGGFYINPSITFMSLQQLVAFHSEASNGLSIRLSNICSKPLPVMPGLSPDARDEWEIPYSSLKFLRSLGKGNFGEVWYGYYNNTFEVAIKCLKSGTMESEDFSREVAVMKKIKHEKIVALYAVCTKQDPWCIVMEYLSKGNLLHYIKIAEGSQLKLLSLANIAAQIGDGMMYLEEKQLIHRDLAARNILVGENNIVKLADFGLARIMDEDIYVAAGGKVPVKWTSPEAYTKGLFTIKSDVWSFGIVLYELFTHGSSPYPGMSGAQAMDLIRNHNYRMPKPTDPECADSVYEIMLMCWQIEPEKRPTFHFLFHFFNDFSVSSEGSYADT